MYTVWVDHNLEGWHPSGLLDTLDDVYRYIGADTYGHPYRITRDVTVRHIEDTADAAAEQPWTAAAMRADAVVTASAAFAVADAEPGSVAAAAAQRRYADRLALQTHRFTR